MGVLPDRESDLVHGVSASPALQVMLAASLAVAGSAKLREGGADSAMLRSSGVPSRLVGPLRWLLPATELIVALLVAWAPSARLGAAVSVVLVSAFTVVLAAGLVRGRMVRCACFGSASGGQVGGGAIARNLKGAGFTVSGFDVDGAKAAAITRERIVVRGSALEAAEGSDLVLTSLPSVAALEDSVAALAAKPRPGLIVAELSTLPIQTKERARDRLAIAGVVMLDCPLSGTGAQAVTRDLALYGSGEEAAFGRCRNAFAGFARVSHYLGAFGNGSKMKFIANHLVAIYNVSVGESLTFARRMGLDARQVWQLFAKSPVIGTGVYRLRGKQMVDRKYLPATMKVEVWQKDMQVIGDMARAVDCPVPLFSACLPIYNAAMAQGLAQHDTAAVCEVLDRMAGGGRGARRRKTKA